MYGVYFWLSTFDFRLINIKTYWVSNFIKYCKENIQQGRAGSFDFLLTTFYWIKKIKAYGQLVLLGFDVTTFTPVAYRRDRLSRPLKVNSSWGRFRA